MQIIKNLLLVAVFSMLGTMVMAQTERLIKEADNAYNNEAYYGAIDMYKKAYAKTSDANEKARMLFQIAESYRHTLDYDQQIIWYNKALKAQYNDPKAFLYLAQAAHRQGDFKQAIENYNKYKASNPGDNLADEGLAEA